MACRRRTRCVSHHLMVFQHPGLPYVCIIYCTNSFSSCFSLLCLYLRVTWWLTAIFGELMSDGCFFGGGLITFLLDFLKYR
jgi:hypothetical protein